MIDDPQLPEPVQEFARRWLRPGACTFASCRGQDEFLADTATTVLVQVTLTPSDGLVQQTPDDPPTGWAGNLKVGGGFAFLTYRQPIVFGVPNNYERDHATALFAAPSWGALRGVVESSELHALIDSAEGVSP